MIPYKNKKQHITEIVLQNLPHGHTLKKYTTDDVIFKWWMTGRQENSLRLTDEGDQVFRDAEFAFYDYPFKIKEIQSLTPHAFILELNKKLSCPYYMGVNMVEGKKQPIIRIYDSKIAVLISLYGNIIDYLESVRIRK